MKILRDCFFFLCAAIGTVCPGGCDANATCQDVNGTGQCVCNKGYVGDGITCKGENYPELYYPENEIFKSSNPIKLLHCCLRLK